MGLLTLFRLVCYVMLWVFAVCTLGMTAARLHYTLHLPRNDPLNSGVHFYDRIITEILAVAALTTLFTPFLIVRIHRRHERGFLSTLGSELIMLLTLFILWTIGAAIATKKWGDLGWCRSYNACRLLTAIVAFTWMSWIMTLFLTVSCIWQIVKNDGFSKPVHGRYRPENDYPRGDVRQV